MTKKTVVLMGSAFIAGIVATLGIRKYLEPKPTQEPINWDEFEADDYDDNLEDFGFDEELDCDMWPVEPDDSEDEELLEDICDYIAIHHMALSDAQANTLNDALEHRKFARYIANAREGKADE